MITQKDNSDNILGSSIFIVLFFFFICAFSHNPDPPIGQANKIKLISELSSQLTALNDAQELPILKTAIHLIYKTNYNLFGDGCKIVAENRTIHHQILFLQKAELLIKTIVLQRFYCQYHSIDTDDLPALS